MMKVFLDRVFKIDEEYQEILIDKDNFGSIKYLQIFPQRQSINNLVYDDIYVIEPLGYYQIILKKNTPNSFKRFVPAKRLLMAGLTVSEIRDNAIYIYNITHNHIFLRDNAVLGEIE